MYTILVDGDVLFDPVSGEQAVTAASISQSVNAAAYLDMTVAPGASAEPSEGTSEVEVRWDATTLFHGRCESVSRDTEGMLSVSCVSDIDSLNDVLVRPHSTDGSVGEQCPSTVGGYLTWLVAQYNRRGVGGRRVDVGVNQGGLLRTSPIEVSEDGYVSVAQALEDHVLAYGGYLDYTPFTGGGTLDLWADVHEASGQVVDLGENVVSIEVSRSVEEQATALVPHCEDASGATLTLSDATASDLALVSNAGMAVNGDAMYDPEAVAAYGYREREYEDEGSTSVAELVRAAVAELRTLSAPTVTVECRAVDMALYREGYEHLRVGQAVRVRSEPHGVDEYLTVQDVDLDLLDPSQTTYTLGVEYDTLTGQQSSFLSQMNASISAAIDAADLVAVDSVDVTYAASDSASGAPSAGWSSEVPTLGEDAPYLWADIHVSYTDGTSDDAYVVGSTVDAVAQQIAQAAAASEAAGRAADEAKDAAQEAWDKAEGVASDVEGAVQEAKDAAQAAQDVAESLEGQLTDITATVNGVQQSVGELATTVTGAVETADAAMTAATEARQTATEIGTTATQALETAEGALTQASAAKQTADSISATLESDYVSKADADTTYATKTELTATSEGLTASVTEAAETAEAALTKATEVEVTASEISTTLTSDYLSKADAEATYATQSSVTQTAESIRAEVSAAASTADAAMERASSVEQTVDGISASVTAATETAESALSQASSAVQAVDGFKQTVSETYATKTELEGSIEQEVLDRNSAIEQSATSITQTVSETYQPKGDYLTDADLDVGGTNLLRNSGFDTDTAGWTLGSNLSRDESVTYRGHPTVRVSGTATGSNQLLAVASADEPPYETGEQLVGSVYLMSPDVSALSGSITFFIAYRSSGHAANGNNERTVRVSDFEAAGDGGWFRVALSSRNTATSNIYCTLLVEKNTTAGEFYIALPQLERGTVATDWSPAPEDLLSTADAEATYATQTELEQSSSAISARVSEVSETVHGLSESVSELELTADGLSVTVASVTERVDDVEGFAEEAQSYLTFGDEGLVIGRSDSDMRSVFTNHDLTFEAGGQEVMVLDGETSTVVASRLRIGNYQLVAGDDGESLSLAYVG